MKSKNLIVVLITLLFVLGFAYFFSYYNNQQEYSEVGSFDQGLILKIGEEKRFDNISIKMVRIKDDSRCPENVSCIWAGKVSADVELKIGEIRKTATLDSVNSPYLFENYLIKIIDVKPEQKIGKEIAQSEYVIFFSIELSGNIVSDGKNNEMGNSGIKGFVKMGPICPVQKPGDKNCEDTPVKTDITIKDKKENEIKSFKTSDDGSFSVSLSPGNYVIYANPDVNVLGTLKPEYVTVEEGKLSEVTIRIDTGIR